MVAVAGIADPAARSPIEQLSYEDSIESSHLVLSLVTLAITSHAQTIEKKSLDLAGAKKAIAAAVDYAKKNNAPGGVIAVVDEGGNLMALERLDDTFAMGAIISVGKARTAVLFKKPTRFFEELINKGRTAMTAVDGFTPLIGGIPIMVDGQVVGGIGVSGAASAAQDEELAIAGANAVTNQERNLPPPSRDHRSRPQLRSLLIARM